jgi:hypothetical protein
VVIDAERPEFGEHDQGNRRQQQRRKAVPRPQQPARQSRRDREQGQQQQRRPDEPGPAPRRGAEHGLQHHDKRGDRRIDEARPVHRRAEGGIVAVFDLVLPGLAVGEIGRRDQPHHVIIVGKGVLESAAHDLRQVDERQHHEPADQQRTPGERVLGFRGHRPGPWLWGRCYDGRR